jgi:hypothetical protein
MARLFFGRAVMTADWQGRRGDASRDVATLGKWTERTAQETSCAGLPRRTKKISTYAACISTIRR